MSQINIRLTGAKAIMAILVVAGFIGFRFFAAVSTLDTDAADELRFWLQAEYSREFMAAHPEPDEEEAQQLLALQNIEFVEISGLGTPEDMAVRAKIRVDGSPPPYGAEVRYFRMDHSMVFGWKHRRDIPAFLYYLNLF
jgi:hypothetical protein